MPSRKVPIETGQIYHVFNQTIEGESAFAHKYHYQKAIEGIWYYRYKRPPIRLAYFKGLNRQAKDEYLNRLNQEPLQAEVIAFVLMPDHYHLLLKQTMDGGISRYMANVQNSYTRYFNAHRDRQGPLFGRQFKAKAITNDQDLLILSQYIHLKPYLDNKVPSIDELHTYDWSSLPEYTGAKPSHLSFCNHAPLHDALGGFEAYKAFTLDSSNLPTLKSVIRPLMFQE
jgi:putative transposase